MTYDDLICELRNSKGWPNLGNAAADCIEQLVNDNHRWKMECEEFWRKREDAAEAKLARAVEAILLARVHVANNEQGWSVGRASARLDLETVNAVLAELEKKE